MIKLEKISKYYQSASGQVVHKVLNDISLEIRKGDSIAIVGPSGCGKSTLLNLIGTLDLPTSGNIVFDGVEINTLDDKKLSALRNKRIGFVFQMHHLLPQLNVLENVLLPALANSSKNQLKLTSEKAIQLLSEVGLKAHLYKFPGQLSGGECQRVAVVRALINEPDIILADEPTGSLDHESAEQIGNLLVDLQTKKEMALVIVTHSLDLADKMKTRYSLLNGQLNQLK
ncbi:MAG: ABC transporter ATP-binding protein [Bacteroidetes bacterium]|nr:ABC transporter ATP-binding protein [Bacteroidota bacterium]